MRVVPRDRSTRRRVAVASLPLALVTSLVVITTVLAAPGVVADFEVDANLVDRDSFDADDWVAGAGGAGVLDGWTRTAEGNCEAPDPNPNPAAVLICDDVKKDDNTFPGGAKEPDPGSWVPIKTSNVTPKTDITNVYALGRIHDGKPHILNAMERLPKAGDVHLDFEFNQAVKTVGSDVVPDRQVGDLFIAYDLGGSRNSNADAIAVKVYAAKANVGCSPAPCVGYDYDNPDAQVTGSGEVSGSGVTALMNTSDVAAGPWKSYDDHYDLTNTIPAFSLAEAAIDIQAAAGAQSVCVNFVTVKSRASESVTSQLKDTTETTPFPFCGELTVKKYVDVDADGSRLAPDGSVEDTIPGEGWAFSVAGPAPSTDVVCSGTTDVNGSLVCDTGSLDEIVAGTYTITETQESGWASTDPGPLPGSTASTVSKTVTIGAGGSQTVYFGNTCFVEKTFEVTDVPDGQSGLYAWYVITDGFGADPAKIKVDLTLSVGTASATVSDAFLASSVIDWGFGINEGTVDEQELQIGTGESLAAGAYPDCAMTNSTAFPTATVSGTKYKDADADGTKDAGEPGLDGFTFDLKSGSTVVATATSDSNGDYSFTGVAPGTYTVVEQAKSGWLQTEPSSGGRDVTVALGDDTVTVDPFGNTPLSDISVIFAPQTAFTEATITCTDADGNTVGSQTLNVHTTQDLEVGTYTCVIEVIDP